jgi:ATP-dependent Lon protease
VTIPKERDAIRPFRSGTWSPSRRRFFPLFVGRARTKAALDQAFKGRREIVLAIQKDAGVGEPGPEDVLEIGLLAQFAQT